MRKDKLAIVALFLLALGGVVAVRCLTGDGTPPAPPPQKPVASDEYRGISLQLHSAHPRNPYDDYVEEIANTGANTINLVVHAYQENGTSNMITMRKDRGPNDERLRSIIRLAKQRGLRVMIMPVVLLDKPTEDEWRGVIKPSNWDSWWEDYYTFITHYARLSQETGVDTFAVGSELLSTEDQVARWTRLIAQVRGVYKGRLTYSSNWDNYRKVAWWDKLDLIGMTTYYDLVGDKEPSLAVMLKSWARIRTEILAWRNAKYPSHQILFTEVGWPDIVTAAKYPWDYYRSKEESPELQAMCFRSFFEAWNDQDAMAGYLVWEWRNHPEHHKERSYVPYGREPTMKVIQEYFAKPARVTTRPATAPAGVAGKPAARTVPAARTTTKRSPRPPASAPAAPTAVAPEKAPVPDPQADEETEDINDDMMTPAPPLDQPEN